MASHLVMGAGATSSRVRRLELEGGGSFRGRSVSSSGKRSQVAVAHPDRTENGEQTPGLSPCRRVGRAHRLGDTAVGTCHRRGPLPCSAHPTPPPRSRAGLGRRQACSSSEVCDPQRAAARGELPQHRHAARRDCGFRSPLSPGLLSIKLFLNGWNQGRVARVLARAS